MLFSGPDLVSLTDLLERRATQRPDATAFVFVPEGDGEHVHLNYAELRHRSRAVGARLAQRTAKGDRALLLFPPGLEFVVAFFGCLAAGVIGVPLMLPRRTAARDSSAAIIADCAPKLAMTTSALLEGRPDIGQRIGEAGIEWLTVSALDETQDHRELPSPARGDIAFLQYTSGSTSTPKGVVVAHDNLLANLEMIRVAMSNREHSTSVGWVPLYHDMGLMMGVMQPLYLGGTSVLMAPAAFMQRPLNWLQTIHRYRAEISCGPNFAYNLCVERFRADRMEGVDLSCWKLALNGAEPVQADTIARFAETFAPYGFSPGTMYPGYGLAEATLLVSGGTRGREPLARRVGRSALQQRAVAGPADPGDSQSFVSCGQSVTDQRIAIVDPESLRRLPLCRVGEIWISGPNVTRGYWRNVEATSASFEARILDEPGRDWLRTGDLGFLDENQALFITGRMKDLIIIRGMNHYPQDIERTVQDSHPALRKDCGAAFSITDEDEGEALAVVQEVERTQRRNLDITEVSRTIREAIARQHEIAVRRIVLIPPATLPKTTSGKIQRGLAKRLLLEGALDVLA